MFQIFFLMSWLNPAFTYQLSFQLFWVSTFPSVMVSKSKARVLPHIFLVCHNAHIVSKVTSSHPFYWDMLPYYFIHICLCYDPILTLKFFLFSFMIQVAPSKKRAWTCDKFTGKDKRTAKSITKADNSRKACRSGIGRAWRSFKPGCRSIRYLGRMGV